MPFSRRSKSAKSAKDAKLTAAAAAATASVAGGGGAPAPPPPPLPANHPSTCRPPGQPPPSGLSPPPPSAPPPPPPPPFSNHPPAPPSASAPPAPPPSSGPPPPPAFRPSAESWRAALAESRESDEETPAGDGLASALAAVRLKKADEQPRSGFDSQPGQATRSNQSAGKPDMMSDLMQRLQSRRAKEGPATNTLVPVPPPPDRIENEPRQQRRPHSPRLSSSSVSSSVSSSSSSSSSSSCYSSYSSGSSGTRPGRSPSRPVGMNINGSREPATNVKASIVADGQMREKLKQELVSAMTIELNRIKQEIILVIRNELSSSR